MAVTAGRFGSEDPERPSRFQFSVLEQLEHVRKRIIYSAIAVCVGVVVAFAVINPIVNFVFKPIRSVLPPGSKLIYTVPGEAFSVYVMIALMAGVDWRRRSSCSGMAAHRARALPQEKRFAAWFILMTTAGFGAARRSATTSRSRC